MFAQPLLVTGPQFHFFAHRQAQDIGVPVQVVIEPARHDSAAAALAAANRGKILLELIEVQTSSYLGEDDIERLDEVYKRS